MEKVSSNKKVSSRETFGTKFGFIMSTAGFAIGLGNIWRFPYQVGMNGGGAFLLVYLIIIVFICIPLFTAEISLGRKSQLSPVAGMRKLTHRGSKWNLIGWFGIIAAFLIMAYYPMIMGWIVAYFFKVVSGHFMSASSEQIINSFAIFTTNPNQVLAYSLLIFILLGIIVTRGLKNGVEKACKVMMPILFIFLIVLSIKSITYPGALRGLIWYLKPDISKINISVILAALGQAFYSVGVGMAAAFAYGSYLKKDGDIPGNSFKVVAFDTIVALLAGLVIFPALFAFDIQPNAGPGLLFVTMPNLFAKMPGGQIFGSIFFFLVTLAGLTSGIGLLEAISASIMDSFDLSRKKAVWSSIIAMYICTIPVVLSFSSLSNVKIFGKNIFDLIDFISGNIFLPAGGLLIALYVTFVWKFKNFKEETNIGSGKLKVFDWWKPFITFIIPILIAIILIMKSTGSM